MVSSLTPILTHPEFEALVADIRPELHRYATRMTGSVIDGEDVVQEALLKAHASLSLLSSDVNLRGWLFRITHNKAIDYLRRDTNQPLELLEDQVFAADSDFLIEEKELTIVALSVFLQLAPRQRSCVILKDVLGYSLSEIAAMHDATVPEVKALLHRGRTRLQELSAQVETSVPVLSNHERERLTRYADSFNARDFDAVRAMLADDIQLDLVGRAALSGAAQVSSNYLGNYSQVSDWHLDIGMVEDHPAILVYDPQNPSSNPLYFMLLTWDDERVSQIRDYRYTRYVMRDADRVYSQSDLSS